MHKQYLGDGVYVQWATGWPERLVLTTEDGLQATNTIVLELEVLEVLLLYIKKWKNAYKGVV